jgi:hypothetical protein
MRPYRARLRRGICFLKNGWAGLTYGLKPVRFTLARTLQSCRVSSV